MKTRLNKYLSDPFWNLVYHLSGKTQTHKIRDQTVKFRTDTFAEFMRFRDLVGERAVIEDLLESLCSDDIFYDVGANVGMYTCFAASKLTSGITVAFEPEPENIAQLEENLSLNALNAETIELALSDTNGTAKLALSGEEVGEGEHKIATKDVQNSIEIETARGDSVIKERGLPTPTVVKIDVEGAELSVLRGLSDTLREHVRLVYVEVHSEKLLEFGDSVPEVRAVLQDAGFDVAELSSRESELFLRASK